MTELSLYSQQLALTAACAFVGFVAVLFARRGATAIVVAALCAVAPLVVSVAAASGRAPDYLWMLSPADQARDLVLRAATNGTELALGFILTAALALLFAAVLASGLSLGAVDRRLGRGARGALALGAPVAVVAVCAFAGVLRTEANVIAAAGAAAWAGVVVAAASFSARARVAPERAVLRLGSVTLFAIFGLVFVAVATLVGGGPADARAHDLAVATALGAVVVAIGGAAALTAGDPDQRLRRATPQRVGERQSGGLVVVAVVFVVVGAAAAVRAGLLPAALGHGWTATTRTTTEPLWPPSVAPRMVLEGEGRSPDVVLFKDGSHSPVPQNDDDVPAILVDVAADPAPLLLALRALGHEHALLVGPRGDGSLGGIYVDTADASLAKVAVAHAR